MKRHGITNVFALAGGLDAWRSVGYPTKTGDQP
jgi:rhodanese-related sulfurtransferase